MPTTDLLRHAVEEARLLARAEILHAKQELRDELTQAKTAAVLAGGAAALSLAALTILLMALLLALPIAPALAALLGGVVLLAVVALLVTVAWKKLPKKPLARTQQRLRTDLTLARERLA